ncbi:MAG: hypothetical protein JWO83_5019 [Caulobacteraceae bacterium]|nr:hypothetical protein [Caulobacteraceae bacterium]
MGYARFRAWVRDAALPLWSSAGCDPLGLGFDEQLREGALLDVLAKLPVVRAETHHFLGLEAAPPTGATPTPSTTWASAIGAVS